MAKNAIYKTNKENENNLELNDQSLQNTDKNLKPAQIYANIDAQQGISPQNKVKLKNAFQPITDVQEVIKNRFQLTYFT